VGEEEAVPGPGKWAELAGEVAGLAAVDVGVVDDGADGLVQWRAGDEAREVVGGGLEWRRIEAEAAGEDHRARRRHLLDAGKVESQRRRRRRQKGKVLGPGWMDGRRVAMDL
jgi:hypothetical protein